MKTNKKIGRPAKEKGEKLSQGIHIALTPKAKSLIESVAQAAHQPTAKWARLGLLKLAKEKWRP